MCRWIVSASESGLPLHCHKHCQTAIISSFFLITSKSIDTTINGSYSLLAILTIPHAAWSTQWLRHYIHIHTASDMHHWMPFSMTINFTHSAFFGNPQNLFHKNHGCDSIKITVLIIWRLLLALPYSVEIIKLPKPCSYTHVQAISQSKVAQPIYIPATYQCGNQ